MADLDSSVVYGDLNMLNNTIKQVAKINAITSIEFGYLTGVTSNIQTQINSKLGSSSNAVSASKLATARTLSLSGDVTGSVSFDGSADVSITSTIADDSHNHIISNVDGLQTALDAKVNTSLVGAVSGIAQLDSGGKIPSSQLPSYVDDVIEGTYATFPATGETGKIYVDTNTEKTYRWSGSTYVEISASIALGETSSTAYSGDKGKATTDSLASHTSNASNPHSVTKTQVGLGNVDNTSDANKPISTATQTALNLKANLASPVFTGTVEIAPTVDNITKLTIFDDGAAYAGYISKESGNVASVNVKGVNTAFKIRTTNSYGGTLSDSVNFKSDGTVIFSGAITAPTFIGALSGNATTATTAGNVTGTVAIANGGTGATTASTALANLGLTATAAELNTLDGIIATATELNYTDGVTSGIQSQLDAKLPLAGGTLTNNLNFSNVTTGKRGMQGTVGDNDYWFVGGGATATNAGYAEIASGDDGGSEPIYARQYNGAPLVGTVARTATLLDASGNTSFPGTVAASAFTGNASSATKLNTARTINGVSFDGTANVTLEPYIEDDETTNASACLVFTDNSTAGFKRLNEDSSLTYNPSTGNLTLKGTLYASSKSFLIPHPTKTGKKLKYGSLEGAENGVYLRGRLKGNIIELPDYWPKLVDEDTLTVQLTSIGDCQKLCVDKIKDNKVFIKNKNKINKKIDCFYIVFAERQDIAKLETEID